MLLSIKEHQQLQCRNMTSQCVHSGYCCRQAPCPFGKWNEHKHQCEFLTDDNMCAKYDEIKDLPGADISPAFGAGCCSPLNLSLIHI